jgi:uncharacterized protein (TIGR03437 family)
MLSAYKTCAEHAGSLTGHVFLELDGTGLQPAGTCGVTVTVGGVDATVTYAGPLDQVNILLPAPAGKGNVNVQLTAGGVAANPVQLTIQ